MTGSPTTGSRRPLVVIPEDATQLAAIVRACAENGVPYVARGSGTGLSGGALPHADGVLVVTSRMRAITEMRPEDQRAAVEPGVIDLDVTRAATPHGYYYAPDPSSQQLCSIGGNVAENSGGAHCLKRRGVAGLLAGSRLSRGRPLRVPDMVVPQDRNNTSIRSRARLASMGASLAVHHHLAHDVDQYGVCDDLDVLLGDLRAALTGDARLVDVPGDLVEAAPAEGLIRGASDRLGHLDVLVCNHAHGGHAQDLAGLTAAALDRHWAVNARAGGRVIWMTSGQGLGPMSDNLAYVASKAALAGATSSVADDLVGKGILLNTINPAYRATTSMVRDLGRMESR